jgi:hypothetical protein
MSQRPEYLQLAPGEDVNSVRDRLSFIRGRRILLIWPEDGTALTRRLDLVLVQREARRRALQLALVTHDEQVMLNAADLGISTFETIGASERGRWKRGRTRMFTGRDQRPEDSPEPEDLMPVASRVKNRRPSSALRLWLLRLLVLLFVGGASAVTAYVVMPSATVEIQLFQELLQTELTITASPALTDVDIDGRAIPATLLRATVQTSGTLNTSGVQSLNDLPAIGVVIFTNQTAQPVEIPAGTTVSTSSGTPILFKTVAPATVPAGSGERAEVAVEALTGSTGSRGNVAAGLINTIIGPLENQVTVVNVAPTTGGETRQFAAVTADDQERLLAIVRGQLQALAYTEMLSQVSDNQLIVIETIRIPPDGERRDWTTFSHNIGEITDTLTLEMRAEVTALALDDLFARQIVFAELSAQKPADLLLLPETFQYTRGFVTGIEAGGSITFNAGGQAMVSASADPARLAEGLAGRTPAAARDWLSQTVRLAPGIAPVIRVEPDWLMTLPLLPLRIQVRPVTLP